MSIIQYSLNQSNKHEVTVLQQLFVSLNEKQVIIITVLHFSLRMIIMDHSPL